MSAIEIVTIKRKGLSKQDLLDKNFSKISAAVEVRHLDQSARDYIAELFVVCEGDIRHVAKLTGLSARVIGCVLHLHSLKTLRKVTMQIATSSTGRLFEVQKARTA